MVLKSISAINSKHIIYKILYFHTIVRMLDHLLFDDGNRYKDLFMSKQKSKTLYYFLLTTIDLFLYCDA